MKQFTSSQLVSVMIRCYNQAHEYGEPETYHAIGR